MRTVFATALVVIVMGCGLTRVKGPAANRPPDERPACTTSDAPLRTDATIGIVGVLSTLVGTLLYGIGAENREVPVVMIVGGIGVSVAMLASSGVGYYRVKACREATAEYEQNHPARSHTPSSPPGGGQPHPPAPPLR